MVAAVNCLASLWSLTNSSKPFMTWVKARAQHPKLYRLNRQCFIRSRLRNLLLWNTAEKSRNWKLWEEKYNNHFVISRLNRESPEYQLAIIKQTVWDDALKVIKTFSYTEAEESDDWNVVMDNLEKYCIGEVGVIFARSVLVSKAR